ncbi:hypothetical protein ACIA5D_26910 [Actinoplanes sp. NPDC051513]|uniref:hypothetical protein n=1 Tax=Actinoplanes sp. NPDC051513 TaxID=3363908 RepID=UPI0037AC5099
MTEDKAWRRIAVLGDSIAVHRGDPVDGCPTRTWPERLVLALAPGEYRNLGVSGARAAEVRAAEIRAAEVRAAQSVQTWSGPGSARSIR